MQSLAGVWDTLLAARGEEVLNSSFQWITTWWRQFAPGKELFVLVAEEGNQLIGIAPLYLARFRRKGVLSFRRAYFLGEGLSDYGALLAKGDRAATCAALLDYLRTSNAWHELRLHNLPQASGHFEQLCAAGERLGYSVDRDARAPTHCLYVDTRGDFQAYLRSTSRDVKKDVPRRLNLIADAGGCDLQFAGEVPLPELLSAMADIHAKRQGELGRQSFFQRAQDRVFIQEIAEQYQQRGWLDYVAMRMNGEIVAYMFGFRYGGVRHSWNVGFDPRYNELSLGKVLVYLWIEEAFRRKEIVEFNFMRGDSEFKRKFTKQHRWNYHFIVRHPRSLYVRGIRVAEKMFKSGH